MKRDIILNDEQTRAVAARPDDAREAYPALERAFAPGWDAPGMDEYDRYEAV